MSVTFLKAVIKSDLGIIDLKNPDIDHDILYKEYLIDTQLDINSLGKLSLEKIREKERRNRISYIIDNYYLMDNNGKAKDIWPELAEEVDIILKKRIMSYAYGSLSDKKQDYPFRHTSIDLLRGPILIRTVMLTMTYELLKDMPMEILAELVKHNFAIDGFSDGILTLDKSEVAEIIELLLDKQSHDRLFQSVLAF
ncbi:MAG: hypothetical protein ACLFSQ_11505 [Candidatus Zixiibacteriota bacterium]